MRLWLDDIRLAPFGWTWAKNYDEAVELLLTGAITDASLDHDLGVIVPEGYLDARDAGLLVCHPDVLEEDPLAKSGYDLCLWMAEHDIWPSRSVRVHSHNPIGAKRMCGVVDRYGPYTTRCIYVPYEHEEP